MYLHHNLCKSANIEAEKHKFTSMVVKYEKHKFTSMAVKYASTCPTCLTLSPSFSFTLSHTHPYPMYAHVHNLLGDDQLSMSMRW